MKNTSKWKHFSLNPKGEQLPNGACTYAVYIDGELVYVGQTNRLRNRFSEHKFRHGYGKTFITPWCEVPNTSLVTLKVRFSEKLGDWAMREIRLISRLQPCFNSHHRTRRGVMP